MNEQRAYIAGGHVYCREHGRDQDIDECMGCPRLTTLNEKASPPYIVCDLTRPLGGITNDDPGFTQWWHQHHRRGR